MVALRKEMENTRDCSLVTYVPSRNSIAMQDNLTELEPLEPYIQFPVSGFPHNFYKGVIWTRSDKTRWNIELFENINLKMTQIKF